MVSHEYPPSTASSGIATYTGKTARTLARLGHEVHVLAQANVEAPRDELRDGVHVHRLPDTWMRPRELWQVRRSLQVSAALRQLGPFDVVQACEWLGEATAYSIHPAAPLVTRLATPHEVVLAYNKPGTLVRRRAWLVRRMERMQAQRSDLCISPSRALGERMARSWGLPQMPTVVPTGIELPVLDPGHQLPAGLKHEGYILYFGRLEPRKGVLTWIDAIPDVLGRQPGLDAVFVGEDLGERGQSYGEIARQRSPELASRIRFLESLPQQDLRPIVEGARLVVFPSLWESVSNACLETMALGRPVVASSGSGFAELISDGVSGVLVPPGDAGALAHAVNQLLAHPEALAVIGQAARARAETFELSRCVARLVEVYENLLPPRRSWTPVGEVWQG